MPTQHETALRIARPLDSPPSSVACPHPLSPDSELHEANGTIQNRLLHGNAQDLNKFEDCVDDNTASGMSLRQESIGYTQEVTAESVVVVSHNLAEKERNQDVMPSSQDQFQNFVADGDGLAEISTNENGNMSHTVASVDMSLSPLRIGSGLNSPAREIDAVDAEEPDLVKAQVSSPKKDHHISTAELASSISPQASDGVSWLAPLSNQQPEPNYGTKAWSFSNLRLSTRYPCSLLHPGSKFEGTQHSDRQVYNVTVSILTVDIPQCTLSGYLKIEGLTPDHPTLTTFFRGEIIGGPNQRYDFRTNHPCWGATDKTDLMHWARFPAWRPLSREAKRDLSFEFPIPGSGPNGDDSWWQQENIFMRWKEEFLVPNHQVTSIPGASFEGFYYICFNQLEGQISGIYFHARSEK